jgi:hypothetical protein
LERQANEIAADQREFKNSFNEFIHLEGEGEADSNATVEERAEAAAAERTEIHNHGIPEPPAGSPENVRQLTLAIRAMWDAEEALSTADTAKALQYEREALNSLKRAQAAIRYIPPILPKHTPIDLKRRYEGELTEIKTRLERLSRLPESKETQSIRQSLASAYAGLENLNRAATTAADLRSQLIAQARDEVRKAADSVVSVSGQHSALIAQSAAQLRIVESELSRVDSRGSADHFAEQIDKARKLLTQAASTLFAIADARTGAPTGDASGGTARRDSRVGNYFKRLAGGER